MAPESEKENDESEKLCPCGTLSLVNRLRGENGYETFGDNAI